MRRHRRAVFLATVLVAFAASRNANAATATWVAVTNGAWTDGASWAAGVPPAAGDDLVFPAGAAGVTATNDYPPGTSFGSITVAGEGYALDGNAIDLSGDIVVTSKTTGPTFAMPIALEKPITVSVAAPATVAATFLTAATIDLGQNTLTASGDGRTMMHGKISGPGGFVRASGIGETVFFVDNNYLGPTTVQAGIVTIKSEKALGGKAEGTTVTGTGALRIMGAGTITFDEPLVFSSSAFAPLASLTGTNTWAGPIVLDVDTLVVGNVPFTLAGSISGAHVLRLSSTAGITLSGANSHSGGTVVQSNGIFVTQPSALGTGPASTWLGAWITVANGTYPNALSLQGSTWPRGGLRTPAGTTTWSGPIDLFSPDAAIETAGTLIVDGVMSGAGGLVKYGAGELVVDASGASYSGGTSIAQGTLRCAVAGAIPDLSLVDVTGELAIDASLAETIGSLSGSGSVVLGTGSSLKTGGNGQTTSFTGAISGDGQVTFVGAGTKYLNGASTYTGPTSVAGGTVAIQGSIVSSSSVVNGARLALGNGASVGAIDVSSGTVAPGWVPKRGVQSGALALGPSASFEVQMDATDPDSFSHLVVIGAAKLDGAALKIGLGFKPAIGDSFPIIENDGSDPVTGTFAGLDEATVVAVLGSYFKITYAGGDGNDVVLTAVVAPPPDAGIVVDGGAIVDGGATVDGGAAVDGGQGAGEDSGVADSGIGPSLDGGLDGAVADAGSDDASAQASIVSGGGCDCRAADGTADLGGASLVLSLLAIARRRRYGAQRVQ